MDIVEKLERLRKKPIEETTQFHKGVVTQEAQNEITNLRNQLAECQKDAERYRFIRDNPYLQIEFTGELTLDEYVDKAINQARLNKIISDADGIDDSMKIDFKC